MSEDRSSYRPAHHLPGNQVYAFEISENAVDDDDDNAGSEDELKLIAPTLDMKGMYRTCLCCRGFSGLKTCFTLLVIVAVISISGFLILRLINNFLHANDHAQLCGFDGCPCECICTHFQDRHFWVSCDRQDPKSFQRIGSQLSPNVSEISLENNGLQSLDITILEKLQHTRVIYLRQNQLSTIEPEELAALSELQNLEGIDLSENPWDCKCNSPTAALVTWLHNFKGPHARREGIRWIALINAYNTTCAAPTEWAGMPLMKLQELC